MADVRIPGGEGDSGSTPSHAWSRGASPDSLACDVAAGRVGANNRRGLDKPVSLMPGVTLTPLAERRFA